jgi:hypothetical protein
MAQQENPLGYRFSPKPVDFVSGLAVSVPFFIWMGIVVATSPGATTDPDTSVPYTGLKLLGMQALGWAFALITAAALCVCIVAQLPHVRVRYREWQESRLSWHWRGLRRLPWQ